MMNQAMATNLWKGTNRVSQLWEDLLANYVPPDPVAGETNFQERSPEPDPLFIGGMAPEAVKMDSPVAGIEQDETGKPSLLERAGFESLRAIRQALEILTAPPEQELALEGGVEQQMGTSSFRQAQWDETMGLDRIQAVSTPNITYIKVSREPDEQPASAIDTRRIAYGLKIPARPLHKRPVYQRLFFSLRSWIRLRSRGGYEPSHR